MKWDDMSDDMSAAMRGLLVKTFEDLDGERLKCRNMISLAEIVMESEDNPAATMAGSILFAYWGAREKILQPIKDMIDALGLETEESERFLRHNYLKE